MRQEEPLCPDLEDQMVRVIVAAMRAFEKGDAPADPPQAKAPMKPKSERQRRADAGWAPKKQEVIAYLAENPSATTLEIMAEVGCDRTTVYRAIKMRDAR